MVSLENENKFVGQNEGGCLPLIPTTNILGILVGPESKRL